MTTMPQDVTQSSAPQLDEERLAWLALALAPGLGPKRILDAVKTLEAASQIFSLSLTELEGCGFLRRRRSSSLTARRARRRRRSGRG